MIFILTCKLKIFNYLQEKFGKMSKSPQLNVKKPLAFIARGIFA